VGPIWRGGKAGEEELLRGCYLNSLTLAERTGIKSIAFPSISTGAYGFPIEHAARIAIATVREYLASPRTIESVVFVCFSEEDFQVYTSALGAERVATR